MNIKSIIFVLTLMVTVADARKKDPFAVNKEVIKSLQTIFVLTDTTLVEDMKGKQIGLNVAYNQNLGHELFANLVEYFNHSINAKLIHSLASVGLYQPENVYFPDYQDINNQIILPVLDDTILNPDADAYRQVLNPLVDRSYATVKTRKERKKYLAAMSEKDFSRIQSLALQQGEAVLLIIATGIKIPTKKSVGQAVATTILTLGFVTGWQRSANQFNAVLISHDGQLLWTDAYFRGGKVSKDKRQESFIKRLFKSFPVKPQKKKRNKK